MAQVEILDEIQLEPEIEQQLAVYQERIRELEVQSQSIQIVDDAGEGAALIFIGGVSRIIADIDDYRDGIVRPHNTKVKKVNESVGKISTLAVRLKTAMDQRRSDYLEEKERKIEEANRLAAAEAERIRLEKEAKEKAQREEVKRLQDEADRLERERIEREIQEEIDRQLAEQKRKDEEAAAEEARRAGDAAKVKEAEDRAAALKSEEEARIKKAEEDRKASLVEQAKLEKKAITLEAKADLTAMEVETVAPVIQFNTSNGVRVLPSGGKVTTREVQKVECWENGTLIYRDPEGKKNRRYNEFDGFDTCIPEELKDFKKYGYLWKFDIATAIALAKKGQKVPGLPVTTSKKTVGSR